MARVGTEVETLTITENVVLVVEGEEGEGAATMATGTAEIAAKIGGEEVKGPGTKTMDIVPAVDIVEAREDTKINMAGAGMVSARFFW